MLEIFALLVLLVLCAVVIGLTVAVARVPGNIAHAANHPQAEAINVLAWAGLLTFGAGWLFALVWAKTKPLSAPIELEQRVAELERKLSQREPGV